MTTTQLWAALCFVALPLGVACTAIDNYLDPPNCSSGENCQCTAETDCTQRCGGGNCEMQCLGAGDCEFDCPDGGCKAVAAGDGDVTLRCSGGNCTLLCHPGEKQTKGECKIEACSTCTVSFSE